MVVPPGDIRVLLTERREREGGADLFFEVHGEAGRVLSNGYAPSATDFREKSRHNRKEG